MFDKTENSAKLSRLGNPLEKLSKVAGFEMFRPDREQHMLSHGKKNNAECKPHDAALMFKIILRKRLHNLRDEQAEYPITDRQSFREFRGLASGEAVPDSRTLWLFQDTLIKKGLDTILFARFHAHLDEAGRFVNRGKLIDATFVEVPRQRNKRGENEAIKTGHGHGLRADQPRKKCQKDIDARRARKDAENHCGCKNHAQLDAGSKLIDTDTLTRAQVRDSRAVEPLLSERDRGPSLHAHSACAGPGVRSALETRGLTPQIAERACRGHPLADAQKETHRSKSRLRCRIEHAFGFVSNRLGGFTLRAIGLFRARGVIGLLHLADNLCRCEQLLRLHLLPAPR